ncbi:MAG: hypothetical protein KGK07_13410 [Chloroflexota bacterium]|nr:hypothetical protein [Chloroflexota bacterium]
MPKATSPSTVPAVTSDGEIVSRGRLRAIPLAGADPAAINALLDAAVDAQQITGDIEVIPHVKQELVGRPFVIAGWQWLWSKEHDAEYAVLHIVRMDEGHRGEQFAMTTGEYGILQVLRLAEEQGVNMVRCSKGLRTSDYPERGSPGDPDYRPAGTGYWIA